MTDPTDDRRDRLRASYAELVRAADTLSDTVAAFKVQLAEQEQALDAARNAEPLRRLEAEMRRLKKQHADALLRATADAEEGAREAARFEGERDAAALRADGAERRAARLEADLKEARNAARAEAKPATQSTPTKIKATTPTKARTVPAIPVAAPPEPSGPVPSAMDAAIADAFRAWCIAASAVVGKVGFFAESLRQTVPAAMASAVYRDANAQAQPIAFGSGGSSPVEYWLVAAEGRHWLFPQPLSPGQFRELAPCFDGAATPATLTVIRPGEVKVSGDRLALGLRGHVA